MLKFGLVGASFGTVSDSQGSYFGKTLGSPSACHPPQSHKNIYQRYSAKDRMCSRTAEVSAMSKEYLNRLKMFHV